METEVRNEPLIQTMGLSGFKAPAHTHCVLSPLPHCTQGDQTPWGMEKGPCWPICWAHFIHLVWDWGFHAANTQL